MMTDVETTDDEVAAQVERADCLIEQLRDANRRNGCGSCELVRRRSASRASADR